MGSIACNGVVRAITKASTSIDDTINGMGKAFINQQWQEVKAFINQQWQEVMHLSFRVRGRGRGGAAKETKVYWAIPIHKSKSVLAKYPKVYFVKYTVKRTLIFSKIR